MTPVIDYLLKMLLTVCAGDFLRRPHCKTSRFMKSKSKRIPWVDFHLNSIFRITKVETFITDDENILYNVKYNLLTNDTIQYNTLRYATLRYATLRYTTLHYTTLHYTTLHYTTYRSGFCKVSFKKKPKWGHFEK
jgi:hypothetical protein